MARAMSTEQAFAEVFDVTVEGLQMQIRANIELMSLYGQSDLGTVESASTVSSKRQVVISKPTWAAGIWPQLEGALVDVYADSTLASKVTSTTYLQVVSVDIANRTITLDGTDYASVTTNNVIVPYGTGTAGASWAKGISKIIQTSGTLFGIDNSGVWQTSRATATVGQRRPDARQDQQRCVACLEPWHRAQADVFRQRMDLDRHER